MSLLVLVMLSASPVEQRGTAGDLSPPPVEFRTRTRLRASVAGTGVFGIARGLPSGGAGLMGVVGVTVLDRLSVIAQLELGTSIVSVIGLVGVLLELTLNDRFSIALGGALSGWRPSGGTAGSEFWGPVLPIRLSFAPLERSAERTVRRGLFFGFQIAPGINLFVRDFDPPTPENRLVFTAALSVGYAIW